MKAIIQQVVGVLVMVLPIFAGYRWSGVVTDVTSYYQQPQLTAVLELVVTAIGWAACLYIYLWLANTTGQGAGISALLVMIVVAAISGWLLFDYLIISAALVCFTWLAGLVVAAWSILRPHRRRLV